jgi:DivIVA domain-containing protein
MEITPQLLKEIEFKEAWRGYDREQVDALLERIGSALAQLQGRLREALDRADAAETRTVVSGARSETEDTLRRTLVLAQRTADAAIAEAEQDASRIRGDAHTDADRLVRDATVAAADARREADTYATETIHNADTHALETRGDADAYAQKLRTESEAMRVSLRAEAEAEARRVAEATRAPLVDEIRELERTRGFLHEDVALLDTHLSEQRVKIREDLTAMMRLLDLPEAFRTQPPPALSGVDVPAGVWPPTQAIPRVDARPAPEAPSSSIDEHTSSPSTFTSGSSDDLGDEGVAFAPPTFTDTGSSTIDDPALSEPALSEPALSEPSFAEPTDSTDSSADRPRFDTAPTDVVSPESARSGDVPPWTSEPSKSSTSSADRAGTDRPKRAEAAGLGDPWSSTGPDPILDAVSGDPVADETVVPRSPSRSDEFLAQLRRAVDDDVEDGPGMSAFFDDDDEEQPRSRFGRRR